MDVEEITGWSCELHCMVKPPSSWHDFPASSNKLTPSLFGFASFQNVIYKLHSREDRFLSNRLSFNLARYFSLFMGTKTRFSSTHEAVDNVFVQILSLSSTKLHGVLYQKIYNLNMYRHWISFSHCRICKSLPLSSTVVIRWFQTTCLRSVSPESCHFKTIFCCLNCAK
jgi:hypothetical protein